jgi:hypothetical protein
MDALDGGPVKAPGGMKVICHEQLGALAPESNSNPWGSDVVVRTIRRMALSEAVRLAILEGRHIDDLGRPKPGALTSGLCLIAEAAPTAQPAYDVVLIDDEGHVLLNERLVFRRAGHGAGQDHGAISPGHAAAEGLARLAGLLKDRTVCVADELGTELDGVREPLREARRVVSLAPMLARLAETLEDDAVAAMLAWLAEGYDSAPDAHSRARFVRDAWIWMGLRGSGLDQ